MKGRVTNLVFAVLLGLCSNVPCTHADTVYLSTYNLNTIDEFNSSGSGSDFATAGSGLNYPVGLAFDSSGNLYVANSGGGAQGSPTIEEFTRSGTGSVFASAGLSFPTALAFDNSGNLFVANAGNNTIEEFNSSGTGSVFATAASGLDYPGGLAFDNAGNLYAANYNNTILKFNTNGAMSVFATAGLDNPGGLAFDSSGNLYAANYADGTIEKFNSSGQGSTFTSTNLLSLPIDLAFDSSGNLYVANHGDGDILEFNTSGIGSVFAYGLEGAANYLADEVPEPSAVLLVGLSLFILPLLRPVAWPSGGARRRPHRHSLTSTIR
jgi:sugar lactone lactonase YvrE